MAKCLHSTFVFDTPLCGDVPATEGETDKYALKTFQLDTVSHSGEPYYVLCFGWTSGDGEI